MSRWSEGALHGAHAHFTERGARAGFSRGQLVRRGAAVMGGIAGLGLLDAASAFGAGPTDPQPIPGGFTAGFAGVVPSGAKYHVFLPEVGNELSTITDFNGVVGAAEIQGSAKGSDGTTYSFDADMRFMQGLYVGMDGRLRRGSFGFV